MDIAKLILEYLQVVLSWPVLAALVLWYFLHSQHAVISQLLNRIKQIKYPGGSLEVVPYSSPEIPPPAPVINQNNNDDVQTGLKKLESEFVMFLVLSLETNEKIIDSLMGVICFKKGATVFGKELATRDERIDFLKGRIDKNAYKDLVYLLRESMKNGKDGRSGYVKDYIKSKALVDYLRSVATRS